MPPMDQLGIALCANDRLFFRIGRALCIPAMSIVAWDPWSVLFFNLSSHLVVEPVIHRKLEKFVRDLLILIHDI
jgi:hypothetical protein